MACHLRDNRFLHEQKYKDFLANEPVNLSGAHRLKIKEIDNHPFFPSFVRRAGHPSSGWVGGGMCIDCHRGVGILDEMKYLFTGELLDLIKYLNNPVEPASLFMPIQDKNCFYCHNNTSKGRKINGFHYYNAHKGVIPVRCVECHIAHDNNMNKEYFFINREKVLNICSKCHRGMSERIKEVLDL